MDITEESSVSQGRLPKRNRVSGGLKFFIALLLILVGVGWVVIERRANQEREAEVKARSAKEAAARQARADSLKIEAANKAHADSVALAARDAEARKKAMKKRRKVPAEKPIQNWHVSNFQIGEPIP